MFCSPDDDESRCDDALFRCAGLAEYIELVPRSSSRFCLSLSLFFYSRLCSLRGAEDSAVYRWLFFSRRMEIGL